jgi:hypothetical protein
LPGDGHELFQGHAVDAESNGFHGAFLDGSGATPGRVRSMIVAWGDALGAARRWMSGARDVRWGVMTSGGASPVEAGAATTFCLTCCIYNPMPPEANPVKG